ncbi:hypothetical protein JCM10212_005148 [Sporobolomyces blumeae]
MSDCYPGHPLYPPSQAEYDEYERRQQLAAAEPLEGVDILPWTGPSLEPDVSPPADYPHARSTSPNPTRPIHRALLNPETGSTSKPWTLKLAEGLQTGVDQRSQVWRAEARTYDDPQTVVPVVVKLRYEALFEPPEPVVSVPHLDWWNWFSAAFLQEREALAYRTARDLQGTDLPICYGFFRFRLPSGEEVVGVVLEDLVETERALPLYHYFTREFVTGRLDLDRFDPIARAAHRLQWRLNEVDIGHVLSRPDQFLYLRSSSKPEHPVLVGISFGLAQTRQQLEDGKRIDEQRVVKTTTSALGEVGRNNHWMWHWRQECQLGLWSDWSFAFSDLGRDWTDMVRKWTLMEDERQALDFLVGSWKRGV